MANTYTQILKHGTYAAYQALATKDSNILYFCTDNGKLFKGTVDFSDNFVQVTSATLPAAGVPGKIYFESDTKKFKAYIGSAYVDITFPVDTQAAAAISAASDENHVPTSKNVYEYGQAIKSEVLGGAEVLKGLAADETDAGTLVVTKGDSSTEDVVVPGVATGLAAAAEAAKVTLTKTTGDADEVVVPGVVTGLAATATVGEVAVTTSTGTHANVAVKLDGVVTTPTWEAAARKLTIPVINGEDVVVDIGKDIFLDPEADNHYDPQTKELVLYLNDGAGGEPTEIKIPVSGLIPVYAGGTTTTAVNTIDSNLNINTAVKVDAHEGNAITVAADTDENGTVVKGGLRVDLSGCATTDALSEVKTTADTAAADLVNVATALTWGTF